MDETLIKAEELSAIMHDPDPSALPAKLGAWLAQKAQQKYDPFSFGNDAGWLMDAFVAAIVGPLANDLLALHQFLVNTGATPESPYDFGHADRYGVAFSDAAWKSMALQTQSYTYMVVLQPATTFKEDDAGQIVADPAWTTHIRVCTAGPRSYDLACAPLASLTFLGDYEKVFPEIGYGANADAYFRYKDGRDRGYLCSVESNWHEAGFSAKDVMWGPAFSYLKGILEDLGAHCSNL